MKWRRRVPSGRIASLARESDGWDLRGLCGVCGSAHSSREGELNSYIATNVWTGECELRFRTIPELWSNNVDAVLDGGDRVRVDVVQARICYIRSFRWTSSRA